MKIVTVIVTYNGMKWIEKCLLSLRSSTIPTTIVVIDNSSTDGTPDFIHSHFSEVVLLRQQNNLGFGQANNVGLRYAIANNADYVLLLNQDAYLQSTALEEMTKVADGKSLYSPLHLSGNGRRLDHNFRESLKRADNELLDDLLINQEINLLYPTGEICAACWFMPIDLIKTVGGFNPLFFQYGEDNNYYTRIQYHKRNVFVVPAAQVWHDRNIHGNENLYQNKHVSIQILVTLCDLNLSTFKKIKRLLGICIKNPMLTLKVIGISVGNQSAIRHSLIIEKENGVWLKD